MKIIRLYLELLKDPSDPENRVVRKAALISVLGVALLIYYRHIHLGFGFGEPALGTLVLAFLVIAIFGLFGGLAAAEFYKVFRRDIGASTKKLTIAVFCAEWLFAFSAPFLGLILFMILSSRLPQ
jgi:hypothetical protein